MELVRIVVIVLVLYGIMRLVGRIAKGVSGSRFRAYRQVARRYGGRYESRGMVDPPTVSFDHGGSGVRVGLAPAVPGQPAGPKTRVVARFEHGQPLRLEVSPRARPGPAQEPRGTRPVRLGRPEFDRVFLVRSNDPGLAAELLERPGFRLALERLRGLAPPAGMLLSVSPERLLVQVDRNLAAQAGLLEAAVGEALALHDALRDGVEARMTEGIAIVAAGPATEEEAGPSMCKVCGEGIERDGPHVICLACRSPSHRDCWDYVGGCPIFGCRGKQCISA